MNNELRQVREFHEAFQQPILDKPSVIPKDRSDHRFRLMYDEVMEYQEAIEKGDVALIAKELTDILYTVYGTYLEHGLQNKLPELFKEVHLSNMSKEYCEYKMKKGKRYKEANIRQLFE